MTAASGALDTALSLIAICIIIWLLARLALREKVDTSQYHRLYKRVREGRKH